VRGCKGASAAARRLHIDLMRSRRAAAVPPNLVYETPCVVVVVVVGRFITIIIFFFSRPAAYTLARCCYHLARSLSICLTASHSHSPYPFLALSLSLYHFLSVSRYFTFSVYIHFFLILSLSDFFRSIARMLRQRRPVVSSFRTGKQRLRRRQRQKKPSPHDTSPRITTRRRPDVFVYNRIAEKYVYSIYYILQTCIQTYRRARSARLIITIYHRTYGFIIKILLRVFARLSDKSSQ